MSAKPIEAVRTSASTDLSRRNAEAVIQTWRSGNHAHAWSDPAKSMLPSEVTRLSAHAWDEIRRAIDTQADQLANLGFQPGLPLMRELRGLASTAAHSAQRAHVWANDLRNAELDDDAL